MDLHQYDVVVINSSAGKDSQAMLDVIVELADEQQYPRERLVVAHADLGRSEWPGAGELAAEHAAHYGLRLEVVANSRRDILQEVRERGMWPDASRRWCTSGHKRDVIAPLFTRLAAEIRAAGGPAQPRILNAMGLRAEESPDRAAKEELALNARCSSSRRTVTDWLPIQDWTVGSVWLRIRQAGTRVHPAYIAGMPRLSCMFCVLAPKSALVRSAQLNPKAAAEHAAVEARVGHSFKQNLSMAEIVAEAERTPAPVAAGDWVA